MSNKIVDYFRKVVIEEEMDKRTFIVLDLIDGSEKTLKLYGKQRLWKSELGLEKGKMVYIHNCQYKMREEWRLLTSTDFKMSRGWFGLKIDIDTFLKAQENEK